MRKIVQDPLVHFLVAGLVLFLLYDVVGSSTGESDQRQVQVGHTELLVFLQQQSKKFDPAQFEKILAAMPTAERDALVDEYVRQEVLVREAKRLGLEKKDYVIRRRLIQKMEFLADGYASQVVALDDDALKAYYDTHLADYLIEPSITFTHVFVDPRKHEPDDMSRVVGQIGETLHRKSVPFSDAPKHGDRFPFHINYVDKSDAFVASHFGGTFRDAIFGGDIGEGAWQGPYQSTYGQHYVMVTKRAAERQPNIGEVRGRVAADARREALKAAQDEAIAEVVAGYDIEVSDALRDTP